jgi:hypothetical protein
MEHISKFIDLMQGNLDENSERSLFNELAMDDDLRADFKCFTSVTDGIKRNMDSFAPSIAVKNRIYSKAGFTIPSEPITPIISTPAKNILLRNGLLTNILTGIATLIATILIMHLFFTTKTEAPANSSNNDNNLNIQKSIVPKVESIESDQGLANSNSKPIIKYVYIREKSKEPIADEETKPEVMKPNENQTFLITQSKIGPGMNNGINNLLSSNSRNDFPFAPKNEATFKPSSFNSQSDLWLSFEMRGSANWNFPKETISPLSYNKFNNMNLSIFYKLSDKFRAGLGVKQETFYTVFDGTESDGSIYKYYEQPNLTTYSGNFRYYPIDTGALSPYLQLGLGLNTGGYVAMPSLGLEYQAYTNLSFILGIEYDYFWFSHQNKWFSASKAGFSYGISYQF